jgi:hypothetical protein
MKDKGGIKGWLINVWGREENHLIVPNFKTY